MRFAKAHGLGNDFVLVEEGLAPRDLGAFARRICERHTGAGADGVLLYAPVPGGVRMRLINADGGEVELSGNGVRCLAAWVCRQGLAPARHTVFTVSGPRPVEIETLAPLRYRVRTGLGPAILRSDLIPMALPSPRERVVDEPLSVNGETVRVTATSLGNPHCALFLDEVADDALVARLGPALERHPAFPVRTNVEFVTVLSRGEIRVRFWERGVGPTLASGTGSGSAFVAAVLKGLVDRSVRAVCDGGVLDIEWPEGGEVRQTGEVEVLLEGDWLASA
jgi:diaminopimelate epimerase